MNDKVLLMVEGMDCANCASTIERTLSKQGFKDVNVDFITGEVSFNPPVTVEVSNAVNSTAPLKNCMIRSCRKPATSEGIS